MNITLQNGGILRVDTLAPHTFRIRLSQNGIFAETGLNRYGILQQSGAEPACRTTEENGKLRISTGKAILVVDKATGELILQDTKGKILTQTAAPVKGGKGYDLRLRLADGEKLYGMGDVTRDRLQKRGFRTQIWVSNVASYVPIPFMMSSCGWGILLNSTFRSYIDAGCKVPDILHCWSKGGETDFYLFAGDSYAEILAAYTDLSGKPTLLPRWAFGLTFVCHMENSARDVMEDAMHFRQEEIPCDLIGLEPGWMETYYDLTTEKKWDPKRFDIPYWAPVSEVTFIAALRRLGCKLSLWLCTEYDFSFYEEKQLASHKEEEGEEPGSVYHEEDDFEKDQNIGHDPIMMDKITKPDEPWFEHLKKFVDQGVSAFKLDGAFQVNEHPDRLYGNRMLDEEMHNLYPAIYNKQMSKGFEDYTGRRAMIYSSGGFTGIQRYSATWAGDTGGGFKPMVSMLNHGMSGHSNTSCDMDDLRIDSIHFGFLQPWSQLNNWDYWKQPWLLTPECKKAFKEYALLRYSLVPTLYSAAHVAYRTGLPMLRAMPLAYPDSAWADNCLTQYLLGDDLMVSAFGGEVTLPEDGGWFDFWTDERLEGGQTITYTPPEGKGGGLFVREGAILTMEKPQQYIKKTPDVIELHRYGGQSGKTTLYEDDGISLAYREGKVAVTEIAFERKADGVYFTTSTTGTYEGMPENRTYQIINHTAETLPIYLNGVRQG